MAKVKTVYVCQECGAEHSKWQGQCQECKAWNTLVEEIQESKKQKGKSSRGAITGLASGKVVRLSEVEGKKGKRERFSTGSEEFDRVLGGGAVPGEVVLVAGEPGIGKSTLLTQLAMNVSRDPSTAQKKRPSGRTQDDSADEKSVSAESSEGMEVLYVCGEESVEQVSLRVERLEENQNSKVEDKNLGLMAETNVDVIVETARKEQPKILIVDSIQTLFTEDLTGMTGSVGQVRESANRLITLAKGQGIPVFIVGHVTKSGNIAGPKVLEHMVDAVVQLEGDRTGRWRIVRAVKNRFGATDEVGVFEMKEGGMTDVANPSGAFLEESDTGVPGSAIVAVMEGTRPVLVEVQALAVKSQLAVPRRVTQGISTNKLQVIAAVLQKCCKLPLGTRDLFVNVVGGLRLDEPAVDLAVALAIASSMKGKALPKNSVVIGEVGLLGEVRQVAQLKRRIKEAEKLGYQTVISPQEYKRVSQAIGAVLK